MQLLYKEIYLDFFQSCQDLIAQLSTGDELAVDGNCCKDARGFKVLVFSKLGMNKIETAIKSGYMPIKAKVKYIVFWKKESSENEIRIILPELYFTENQPS